ncbi:hypothetical protein G3M48_002718 [Beauveria asiatica]|uniref:Uncharacterized protein n=1 Tax=Beauveria asiatica TaxID=1069075 RepID=A0AAW0RXB5_9HYPO
MEQEERLLAMEDNTVAAAFAAETAEKSIARSEFSTTNVPTTETPTTAETRNTDGESSRSTDSDSDSDSDDDDDFADDPEAVVYEHNSATGAELLARIRTALAMHPTTPFAEVRRFLEHNGSVIRHLVTMTVPHPDQYVTEPATGALHELAVRGANKEAPGGGGGGETLVAVAMLDWHSPLIDRHLANMVFYERERKTIRFREVMRKRRRGGTQSRGAYRWLRAHNATSRIWDDEQRRAREWRRRRRLRVQHRGSWLVNEVRADGDEAMEE